jgi:hypothetical protein
MPMPDDPTDDELRLESIAISELARAAMSDAESDGAPYDESDRQRVCRFFAVLRKRMGWAGRRPAGE